MITLEKLVAHLKANNIPVVQTFAATGLTDPCIYIDPVHSVSLTRDSYSLCEKLAGDTYQFSEYTVLNNLLNDLKKCAINAAANTR